jgi:hypothetical protein
LFSALREVGTHISWTTYFDFRLQVTVSSISTTTAALWYACATCSDA